MSSGPLSILPNMGFSPNTPIDEKSLSRVSRQTDLDGAYSGYGGGHEIYCPEGIPVEQALFGILAAFGVSFGFLFRAITLITARRKKRSAKDHTPVWESLQTHAADIYWWGRCQRTIKKSLYMQ